MANILLVQSFIPSRRFALISIKKGELILILSLSIDKKRTITPFRLSFAARRRAGQEIRNRKEKENIGKHSILRTIDRFFIFHMFIDYRKLFAHLLSNFDLDLYKSILFIVISKIIKYTFFEIRFLEFFVFPFSRNIVSWNIYFFKKKKRKKFLSSNMATQCFQYRFVNISKRRAKKQRIRPIIITSFSIFEIAPLEI